RAFISRYCCIIGVKAGSFMNPRRQKRIAPGLKTTGVDNRSATRGVIDREPTGRERSGRRPPSEEEAPPESERREGRLFVFVDLEQAVNSCHAEDLVVNRLQSAELQLPLPRLDFLVERDEFRERIARQELDVLEVDQKLGEPVDLHQVEELDAHVLDRLVADDPRVHEV